MSTYSLYPLLFLLLSAQVWAFDPEDIAAFAKPRVTQNIIGGESVAVGEFPWSLSLQVLDDFGEWQHTCGASLLDERWAITAAHCVQNLPTNRTEIIQTVRVVGGSDNITSEEAKIAKVWHYRMHPWYLDTFPYICDIALLRLRAPYFDLSDPLIGTVRMPRRNEVFDGSQCVVAGFGVISDDIDEGSPILLKGEVTAISRAACRDVWTYIWIGHICDIDFEEKSRSCRGDSGSALMCLRQLTGEYVMAGVVSWGESDCLLGNPTVNGRIAWNYIYNFIVRRYRYY